MLYVLLMRKNRFVFIVLYLSVLWLEVFIGAFILFYSKLLFWINFWFIEARMWCMQSQNKLWTICHFLNPSLLVLRNLKFKPSFLPQCRLFLNRVHPAWPQLTSDTFCYQAVRVKFSAEINSIKLRTWFHGSSGNQRHVIYGLNFSLCVIPERRWRCTLRAPISHRAFSAQTPRRKSSPKNGNTWANMLLLKLIA